MVPPEEITVYRFCKPVKPQFCKKYNFTYIPKLLNCSPVGRINSGQVFAKNPILTLNLFGSRPEDKFVCRYDSGCIIYMLLEKENNFVSFGIVKKRKIFYIKSEMRIVYTDFLFI